MLRLIINADDFGLTPGCNAAIVRALSEGAIGDTTLMINSEFAPAAVALLRERGINQVGLHLNMTCGTPVLPTAEVSSLVDGTGRFRRKVGKAIAAMDPREVEREFAAQAEKFLATGLMLTHLDSHHHAHTYPEVFPIALAMAKKLGVPMRQISDSLKREIVAAGVKTSDWFSWDFYDEGATLENIERIISQCPDGVLEIMSHPGEPEELIYSVSSYNAQREKELAVLMSPEFKAFLRERDVELISFAEL